MDIVYIKSNDKEGWRWYDKKWISVTTILSNAVANPGLNRWFKNNSAKKIEKVQRETSTFGTDCHVYLEDLLKGKEPYPKKSTHRKFIDIFKRWIRDNNVKPIHLEKQLVSERDGYAGTADFIGSINGKEVIADWKVTRSYKITNGWQLAAYRMAYQQECGKYQGLMGVQFNRITGVPKIFEYEHYDFIETRFLHALEVFKGLHFHKLKKENWKWVYEDSLWHKRLSLKNPQ